MARELTAVGLCNDLGRALRMHGRLAGLAGVRVRVLVAGRPGRVLLRQAWCLKRHWPRLLLLVARGRLRCTGHRLHDARTLEWLRRLESDVGLHDAGLIYRRRLIDCFRLGILNPHIGILPAYRGRSVMEWSILHGDPTGITTFFVDEGIDTGPNIVLRETVPVDDHPTVDAAKAHLFSLDLEMFARALGRLVRQATPAFVQRPEEGRRFYVMSELFRGVVQDILAASKRNKGSDMPLG